MKKLLMLVVLASTNIVQAHEIRPFNVGESVTMQEGDVMLNVTQLKHTSNALTSKRLLQRYVALELEIKNTGKADYLLTNEGLSLPVTPVKCVAKKYPTSFSPLFPLVGTGAGLVGGLFLRVAVPGMQFGYQTGAVFAAVMWNAVVPVMTAGVGLAVGLAVSGVSSVRSSVANKKRRKLLSEHAIDLGYPLEIKAGTTIQKIVYVRKKKFTPEFTLTLEKMGEAKTIELSASL